MIKRVILLILDSVGIGALPDADKFGDVGSNTLGNIIKATGGINLPNLQALGLGNIEGIDGIEAVAQPAGAYGRSEEISSGKDTTTGHWEIAGLHTKEPFKTFPDGFPREVMDRFEKEIGRGSLGNYAASGTVIIEELGKEHMETGKPIVYTSADSVFQIAAHEDIIPIDELYRMCEIAREIMRGEYALARIIARPFIGEPGSFSRTHRRKDYSLDPAGKTVLDYLKEDGQEVVAVGKIEDIFNGKGITQAVHTKSNMDGVDQTLNMMKKFPTGLIFTNLVDFDMKFGHRRDPEGYRKALEEADARLPEMMELMTEEDLLIITADHGNDPTYEGSDHTREYVPILVTGEQVKAGAEIGTRRTFADIASTISEVLGTKDTGLGTSFAKEVLLKGRDPLITLEMIQAAAAAINEKSSHTPEIGMILGSGLGVMADDVENPTVIPYEDIPHFPLSTVEGHAGELVIGTLSGKEVVMMKGRFHFYEGYDPSLIAFPIRVLIALGIKKLIVTNAAGGVNESFNPGDLMLITDHLNLAGTNPLIGKNDDQLGPRFPDMSNAYDQTLMTMAKEAAAQQSLKLQEGVYAWFSGPNYETPAEVRMARVLGADAVGMSTVPEVLVAVHGGVKVLGISCITNMAAGILDKPLNHNEVMETARMVELRFKQLVRDILAKM